MPATPALPLELWLGKGRRGNPGRPSLKQEFSLRKREGDSRWFCGSGLAVASPAGVV